MFTITCKHVLNDMELMFAVITGKLHKITKIKNLKKNNHKRCISDYKLRKQRLQK